MAVVCANASFSEPAQIERFKNMTKNTAIKIFEFMSNWIHQREDGTEISSLRMLSQLIAGEIDGILHPNTYKGYVIMYNTAYTEKGSEIYIGLFSQSVEMIKAYGE